MTDTPLNRQARDLTTWERSIEQRRADAEAAKMLKRAVTGETVAMILAEFMRDQVAPLLKRVATLEACQMSYAGVWRDGDEHPANTLATCSGSLWIARSTTRARPGTDATWQLIAKRGGQ